jgi:hypothetical protein
MAQSRMISIAVFILTAALLCPAQQRTGKTLTVVLSDGHQKSFSISDVSRIEFNKGAMLISQGAHQESIPVANIVRIDFNAAASTALPLGRNHFVGRWEFGTGVGSQTFFVTLDRDGHAHKSIGSPNGTWTVVDGEARITWDDGWRDVIRKVGDKHQKFAYEEGKSLTDDPSNVTDAKTLNNEPI